LISFQGIEASIFGFENALSRFQKSALKRRRFASAVIAKPSGTRMPRGASAWNISPGDAFLPPTSQNVGHADLVESAGVFHVHGLPRRFLER
jgi:hypothetical protein